MTALYFVDTNVLVYLRDTTDSVKHARAYEWLEALTVAGSARTSFQVLSEFYDVVTRRRRIGMTRESARADIRDYLAWGPMQIDERIIERAWTIQDRYGFSWWDSLVVASAQGAGCEFLLTEDLQHRQRLEGLTVINPFEMTPDQALL